jgi:4-hydroxybenzoate polyprenyltransferase
MVSSRSEEQMRHAAATAVAERPLLIDVEHGLLRCDLAAEAAVGRIRQRLDRILDRLARILGSPSAPGRPSAQSRSPDIALLPVNAALAALAEAEAAKGRPVYLVTAGGGLASADLAKRFPFAAGVIAPGDLADPHPASMPDALARRFPGGFDYAASPAADPAIWPRAAGAILVGAAEGDRRRVAALTPVSTVIPAPPLLPALLRGMRLHQWTKNLLVFAPFILGGAVTDPHAWLETVLVFLAMGLVSSSTYLVNDMIDVADDRRHWSKRHRPIAGGDLPIPAAAAFAAIGLAGGLGLAAITAWQSVQVLLVYVGLTLAYSLAVKRLPLVDGFALATLFTLRLALGVVATDVPPSPWLFVFSMFLFTSLSFAKRYTELDRSHAAQKDRLAGRGYRGEDAPLVLAVGIAAGLGAVVIMLLYILEDAFLQSFYGSAAWLWGFPPAVFLLICRIWLVTVRGEMNDDPVKFMIGDGPSRALLVLLLTCFAFAWLT